jgi:hypothetical protein
MLGVFGQASKRTDIFDPYLTGSQPIYRHLHELAGSLLDLI